MIRILIVDDHTLVRKSIRAVLEREPGMEIIGEAADGAEGVEMITREAPDIALVDISMPRLSGLQVLERVAFVPTRIIILSMHEDSVFVNRVMRSGAFGYVTKQTLTRDLLPAVLATARGEQFLSTAVSPDGDQSQWAAPAD